MRYGKYLLGLVLLGMGGYLLFAVLGCVVCLLVWGENITENVASLLMVQFFSGTGAFLFPALWLNRRAGNDFLRARCGFSWKAFGWALLAYALLYPVVEGLIAWSEGWHLDESSWWILRWLDERGKEGQQLLESLFHTGDPWLTLGSLFVVGPVAGLCEEFFFRGGIQNLVFGWFGGYAVRADTGDANTAGGASTAGAGKRFHNIRLHAAVWLTAFVFSAVHIDLAGFLPRLLLGALLGYAYAFSGSIWLPVALHTFNNLLTSVLEMLK